jgi:hypothetical protein
VCWGGGEGGKEENHAEGAMAGVTKDRQGKSHLEGGSEEQWNPVHEDLLDMSRFLAMEVYKGKETTEAVTQESREEDVTRDVNLPKLGPKHLTGTHEEARQEQGMR